MKINMSRFVFDLTKPVKRPAYKAWRANKHAGGTSFVLSAAMWREADEQFKAWDRQLTNAKRRKPWFRLSNIDPRLIQQRYNAMKWRQKVAVWIAEEVAEYNKGRVLFVPGVVK